jgi:hypothetical protein
MVNVYYVMHWKLWNISFYIVQLQFVCGTGSPVIIILYLIATLYKNFGKLEAKIPYKDAKLTELISGVFLWVIWLEKNNLTFKGGPIKSIRQLGGSIIALTKHWCQIQGRDYQDNLHNNLPSNVNSLPM